MYPHRIRLRGPWEYEPLAYSSPEKQGQPLPPPGRMKLPCRWRDGGLSDFAGAVRFRRRFGYPGRIDDYERVWLTLAGFDGDAEIFLNGSWLGRHSVAPVEMDVSSLLNRRNRLEVVIESATEDGGLWGEVALEVRCSAYLRDFRAWVDRHAGRLRVHGAVVGTCSGPLELYLMAGRRSIGYSVVETDPAGKLCQLEAEIPEPLPQSVRVDLVNVAKIWYAIEVPVSSAIDSGGCIVS